jgi:hypothetical protein
MPESLLGPVPATPASGKQWRLFTGVTLGSQTDALDGTGTTFTLSAGTPPVETDTNFGDNFFPETIDPSYGGARWSFAGITRYLQARIFVNAIPTELMAVEVDKASGFAYGSVPADGLAWTQNGAVSATDQIKPVWQIPITRTQNLDGNTVVVRWIKAVGDVWVEIGVSSALPPATQSNTTPGGTQLKPPPFSVDWPRVEVRDDFVSRQLGQTGSLTWFRMRWSNRRYLLYGEHEQYTTQPGQAGSHYTNIYTFVKIPGLTDAGTNRYFTVGGANPSTIGGTDPLYPF